MSSAFTLENAGSTAGAGHLVVAIPVHFYLNVQAIQDIINKKIPAFKMAGKMEQEVHLWQ